MNFKIFRRLISYYNKLTFPKWFFAATIAIAAGIMFYQVSIVDFYSFHNIYSYVEDGRLLLHGLNLQGKAVNFNMPFMGVLNALIDYCANSNYDILIRIISGIAISGVCILSFLIALKSKGKITAALTLLLVLGISVLRIDYDLEQIIYSFFVMFAVGILILRNKIYTLKMSVMSGLIIGFSYFSRSPLVLLPFLIVFVDYFKHSQNFKKYITNSIVFLLASYILLIPWIRLNYHMTDKFVPFEYDRASCNIITGVKGSTFTMEGDAKQLIGLKKTESVYKWAVKELLKHPLPYLKAVARRMIQISLMYPLLVMIILFGLIKCRDDDILLASLIAGYFIFIHCLLSIEERYMYPLRYLLAFPAAGILVGIFTKEKPKPLKFLKFARALFFCVFILILAIEIPVIAYPYRAKFGLIGINREIKKFPNDQWLLKKKGEIFLGYNMTYEGLNYFNAADKNTYTYKTNEGFILKATRAKDLEEIKNIPETEFPNDISIAKMLKELELNEMEAAKKSFFLIKDKWNKTRNTLRKPICAKDFEILKEIKNTNLILWDMDIYKALFYWPVEKRFKIISNLEKITFITPNLKYLKQESLNYLKLNSEIMFEKNKFKSLQAEEFNYNEAASVYLVEILNHVEGRLVDTKRITELVPLSLMDEIISQEIKIKNSENLIDIFSPNANCMEFTELRGIVKLLESIPDETLLLRQSQKMAELYPNNFLYTFINYRISSERFSAENNRLMKSVNAKLAQNIYPLLIGGQYFSEKNKNKNSQKLFEYAGKIKTEKMSIKRETVFVLQQAGEYAKALKILNKLISKDKSSVLYNDRGVVFRLLQKPKFAIEDFKKAIKLNPHAYQARLNLASLYKLQDNTSLARKIYSDMVSEQDIPSEIREIALEELKY